MRYVNWAQERPSFEESLRIWDREVFTPLSQPERTPCEFLDCVTGLFTNGGARFARFQIAEDERLDWFASRNRLEEISFVEHLLNSGAIATALPDLKPVQPPVPIKLEWSTPYVLDGELAGTLMAGGAYASFAGTGQEAKRIGQTACERLFDHCYEDILLFRTFTQWSEWFYDIAWDSTWIGVDKRDRTTWVLCITDTD